MDIKLLTPIQLCFIYRDSGLMEQGVRDLEAITGEFNVDDINKIIHNTGYLSVFLINTILLIYTNS